MDEVYNTHINKLAWPEELANSYQDAVRDAFPEAMITDYQELILAMTNDEKDRHVLAAAVKDKLNLIITFNLKVFKETIGRYGGGYYLLKLTSGWNHLILQKQTT